jgi:transposase
MKNSKKYRIKKSFLCPSCRVKIDRDLNAAKNIEKEGLNLVPTERREFKPVEMSTSGQDLQVNLANSEQVQSAKQETQGSSVLG